MGLRFVTVIAVLILAFGPASVIMGADTDGETIDLTKVNVVCKSGYNFLGWYYADADGNIMKVNDLEHFKPMDHVKLYALAAPGGDEPVPVSGGDNNLTIILVVTVLVAIVRMASVIIVVSRH